MQRNAVLLTVAGIALGGFVLWWAGSSPEPTRGTPAEPAVESTDDLSPGRSMRWQRVASPQAATEAIDDELESLKSVGYLAGYNRPGDRRGVSIFKSGTAWDGLNLYISGHAPVAYLMDMKGDVLHEWRIDYLEAFPDTEPRALKSDGTKYLRRVHLFENGDLLAIFDYCGLVCVDRDSRVKWASPRSYHHDLFVDEERIYAISEEQSVVPEVRPGEWLREDFLTVLDTRGTILKSVSILRAFANSEHAGALGRLPEGPDIFHTNTVQILDGSHVARSPAFAAGNALVSLRNMNLIAILDLDLEQVVWKYAGGWSGQHDPVLLDNGNMLIFDNGRHTNTSRVLEFDPTDMSVLWSQGGTPDFEFFTLGMGTNQRLPNGNTLIVDSFNGRVFEVTPDHEIAWRFDNPARAGVQDEFVAIVPDMIRIDRQWTASWLR